MLSRQLGSLQRGRDSHPAAAPLLLAFPPYPTLLLTPTIHHSFGVLPPVRPLDSLHDPTHTQSEHVESATASHFCLPTSKEEGRRRMMPAPFSSTKPIPARQIRFAFPSNDTQKTTFTFTSLPRPDMALSFPPRPSPPRPRKRTRATADIDGEHSCLHKKKRRLRLFLVTSRLSPQFSHPATNIVDRGSSKIAVWAKQKALGRNLLRKAAVFNRLRRRAMAARGAAEGLGGILVEQEKEQEQLKLARLAFLYGSHDTHTRPVFPKGPSQLPTTAPRVGEHFQVPPPASPPSSSKSPSPPLGPRNGASTAEYRSPNDAYNYSPPCSEALRRSHIPLPSSPLGLSNYDAFDIEENIPDPYAHLDDEYDTCEPDEDTPSCLPVAPALRPSTERRDSGGAFQSPPQPIYSDFSILDPDEPVVGDYDQVDEGADAVWPSAFVPDTTPESAPPLSSSPDFPAIFATTRPGDPLPPNFIASSLDLSLSPTSSSPNFALIPRLADRPDLPLRGNSNEIEEERERQKRLMFMKLGS